MNAPLPRPAGADPLAAERYALHRRIAVGGMASVHLGRQRGSIGFGRTVAIKRLHPQFAADPAFVAMFLDEARLAMRVRHPNVVPTLDVVSHGGELFLVMEYVLGESLSALGRAAGALPPAVASAVLIGVLEGLHAAHEARGEDGAPLDIVHRDVSPQNVLVGVDGVARVVDFGVAKAAGRLHTTRGGEVKGKMAYMAPEQLVGGDVDRRADLFSAAVVLWEALTGRVLFDADNPGAVVTDVLSREVSPPSALVPALPAAIDQVVMRGLERNRELRFASAREMAVALEQALPPASTRQVGTWVEATAGAVIAQRAGWLREVETATPTTTESDFAEDVVPSEVVAPVPRRRPVVLAATSALVVALALVAWWSLAPRSGASSARPQDPAPAAVVATPPAAASGSVVVATPPAADPSGRVDLPAPDSTPVASRVTEPPSPPRPRRASAPRVPRSGAAGPRVPGPASTAKCANAFKVGPDGVLIPRPECF